jgi:hypothetical protein
MKSSIEFIYFYLLVEFSNYLIIIIPPTTGQEREISDYILESRLRIKLYIKLKYKTEIWEKCHSGIIK